MADMYLYDSSKKKKLLFESLLENEVKIYVCGPTVYDDSHLGHARSAIVFDLLHRVLLQNDYKVTMVKNFTDIDDKIIKKIKDTKKSLEEITTHYIKAYKSDMDALNILENTLEPKATQNLQAMKDLINILLKKDNAYVLNDGVYLDTSKDKAYGSISNRISDDNSLSRVQGNEQKRDQKDFALWKFNTDEVSYDSDFGAGRPGWHCECSAMIDAHLSDKSLAFAVDIHGGGADLLFPHHENEASQTRLAYNQEIAKYWMHNGFVNIDGTKMSKSLGNSFFLKDALEVYDGEVIRFYMLTTHYRSEQSFNTTDLEASKKRLDKLYRLKKRVYSLGSSAVNKDFKNNVMTSLNDDLNTSKALSFVDEYISNTNDSLDKDPKNKNLKKEIVASFEFISNILGILTKDAYKYFQFGINEEEIQNIETLIKKRNEAKRDKNFVLSDKIRDELSKMNINIMDSVSGTLWEKI